MEKKDLQKNVPDMPGVYLFKKRHVRTPLYIGKATSLRSRIRSYLDNGISKTRSPLIVKMIKEAEKVEIIQTDSVLEALLLETEFIKKFKPPYNSNTKDDKSANFIAVTKEAYPQVLLVRGKQLSSQDAGQYRKIYGPFPHGGELREALKIIRKIFPWRDSRCIPFHRQSVQPYVDVTLSKACFNRQIGLCPGVCTGEISQRNYRAIIKNLELFLAGNKKQVLRNIKIGMSQAVKHKNFEEAGLLRNQMFSIKHIQDIALLKKEKRIPNATLRIEAYDIAHISGTGVVGGMVVMEGGSFQRNEYRKFRIRGGSSGQNNNLTDRAVSGMDDTGNLREVLRRRFAHTEWALPTVMVVDGGTAQVNTAKKILDEYKLHITIVGVVKDAQHKPNRLLGPRTIIKENREAIVLANQEAHRFAITYHRLIRSRQIKKW